jgi:two-component system phosphate regulon sensor histidine kinase PhoR
MNPPPTPDLSLYQLALDAPAPPQALAASPATLKSLVGSLVDVLIEQQVPAKLWVKLPPGDAWWEEIHRYRQQVGIPQTIYLCYCFGDDPEAVLAATSQGGTDGDNCEVALVQLAAGSQLRRENFVLMLSDQLCSVVLTQRQLPKLPAAETSSHQEASLQPAVFAFNRPVIQRVLEGIKETIVVTDTTPDELLADGDLQFSWPPSPDPTLLTQLLVKQLQHHEEIGNGAAGGRPKDRSLSGSDPSPSEEGMLLRASATEKGNESLLKDEFLKSVAQELRTPLTHMKTALRLLDSPNLKPAQRQRYMQLLHSECDRQNSLIAGFLELVYLERLSQESASSPVQLADVVPGIVSTYQPLAEEQGIQFGYTIPAGLPMVSCRETWLRQIVINLLNNTLKFTPPGGQVRVKASVQGDYVQLAFTDTGIGIAPNDLPKIFSSFYRGRSVTGEEAGAGLGLTIVQQLLLRCGGSISVTSRLGEGSNFKVLLPVAVSSLGADG